MVVVGVVNVAVDDAVVPLEVAEANVELDRLDEAVIVEAEFVEAVVVEEFVAVTVVAVTDVAVVVDELLAEVLVNVDVAVVVTTRVTVELAG